MGISILAFIVVLGPLVFFHEFGHFLAARLMGVGVEKFSLGFGPRIAGKTVGRTDYRLSAIPLGGYVKMVGEDPEADMDPEDLPLSFTHKSLLRRFFIVLAGPLSNIVLAISIFFFFIWFSGERIALPVVGKVVEDSPAAHAGLQPGDRVTAINETALSTWEEMTELVRGSDGRTLALSIERGGEPLVVRVTPEKRVEKNLFGEDIPVFIIGIVSSPDAFVEKDLSIFESAKRSVAYTGFIITSTAQGVTRMIRGTVAPKDLLGGPIFIAQVAGEQARQGIANLLHLIAFLSVSLGVINLLPIPILDGGHLLFFTIEAVIRRPLNTRMREMAQQAGLFVLILLMIFVFYVDIARIFSS